MKDPLAGYFQAGGNVGFRRKPVVGGGANPGVPSPVGQDVLGPIQNEIPNPSSSAPPAPATVPSDGADGTTWAQGGDNRDDNNQNYDTRSGGRVDVNDPSQNWYGAHNPAAGSLSRDLGAFGIPSAVADFIDPFDKVAETPGITGGYGGISGSDNYGLARSSPGTGQGISSTKQDLGWDLTRYGDLLGGYALPGQGIASAVGGAILDNQIDAIDSSFDNLTGTDTSYDTAAAGDTISISDAAGNVHQMTKGEYDALQSQPGSASWAADYNAGNFATTQDYGGTTVTSNPNLRGTTSSFIDANNDGVQQSNERSAVTNTQGEAVTSGQTGDAVTSRSQDEIDGYYGGHNIGAEPTFDDIANDADWATTPSQYSSQEIADWAAAHPDIVNDPAALAAVQAEYGVSPAEFAAATGSGSAGAEQRNREDIDAGYSSGNWDTGSTGYHDYEAQAYDVPAAAPEPPAPEPAPAPDPSLGASLSPQQIASHIAANPALSSDPAALTAAMEAYGVSASQVDAATGGLAADLGVDTTSISRSSGWDNSGGGHGDYGGGTGAHVDSEGDSWGSSPFAEGGMVHEDEYIRRIYERLFG